MSITIRSAQTIQGGVTLRGNYIPIITYGLILWLDAANPASYQPGFETWFDLTSNHYDAGLYGSNFEAAWDGKGLDFANNNYAQIAPANMFNGDMTAIGWVYVRSYQNWSRLFDFGNGAPSNNVLMAVTRGILEYPVYANNTTNLIGTSITPLNQWCQLAATQTGTVGTLYLNGVAIGTIDNGGIDAVMRNYNYIGRSNWITDAYLDGRINTLRMYNRALSSAEITSDYNAMLARLG